MGNHHSSDKDTVLQNLWKTHRAIPVVPLNPNLGALHVLTKDSNCYHDVGNVISLSKSGQHQVLSPRKQKNSLTTKSMGTQSYTVADNHGAVATKLTDAPAWFKNATSIEVHIPECWVREYNMENSNWDDMVHHFNPDMQKVNSKLKNPDRSSERELFIVQKVVLVSHITITATYTASAGPDVGSPVMLQPGLQIKPRILDRGIVEFTISRTQENQKLPIAFSGFRYTFDKFGQLKSQSRTQADSGGASSSHAEDDEDEEDEDEEDEEEAEDDEEDVAADDADMGDFLDNEDWFAQIVSMYDPTENEIFDRCDEGDEPPPPGPPVPPAGSPPGSPRSPRDLEDID